MCDIVQVGKVPSGCSTSLILCLIRYESDDPTDDPHYASAFHRTGNPTMNGVVYTSLLFTNNSKEYSYQYRPIE